MVYPALLPLMRTPLLPVVDWTDAPADLNGLVRCAERRNLVSARVPSHFNWPLPETLARQRSGWGVKLNPHLHLVPILRLSEPITLLPLTPRWRVRWLHCLCFSLKISTFFIAGASEWYILGVWQKDFVHLCVCVCVCMWARQLQGGQCVIHRDILQFVPTRHHALGFLHLRRSTSTISPSHKCISEIGK